MPSYFWMRLVERVDGFEVEVVGGFVEDEDVGLLQHDLAEEQACGFASRESVGLLMPSSPLKSIWPRMPRMSSLGPAGRTDGASRRGHAELDGALVVLREVSDGDFVAPLDGAGVDGGGLVFDRSR